MLKILLLTTLLWGCCQVRGQDFSNEGKEFWLGFGNHQQRYTGSLPGMDIYITSNVNTRVSIDLPAMGILIGTYGIRAGESLLPSIISSSSPSSSMRASVKRGFI